MFWSGLSFGLVFWTCTLCDAIFITWNWNWQHVCHCAVLWKHQKQKRTGFQSEIWSCHAGKTIFEISLENNFSNNGKLGSESNFALSVISVDLFSFLVCLTFWNVALNFPSQIYQKSLNFTNYVHVSMCHLFAACQSVNHYSLCISVSCTHAHNT